MFQLSTFSAPESRASISSALTTYIVRYTEVEVTCRAFEAIEDYCSDLRKHSTGVKCRPGFPNNSNGIDA